MKTEKGLLVTRLLLFLSALIATGTVAKAQIIRDYKPLNLADSLRQEFDNGPYFTLYKDNYFTVGGPIGQRPTGNNCDVKFQISISQRLTKSTLPWNTFLFVTYTQKTFWNVFEKSMPMADINFNPGIGLSKPLFNKDRYIGKATILFEHESNGRDSILSRSWERISFIASIAIDNWLTVHGKFWIPIVDSGYNSDLLYYTGIYQTGVSVSTPDKRFCWNLLLTKRKGWNLNFNTTFEFGWRVNKKWNQYLFLQYYNGYGENLLYYKQFHSRLRVGFVIKPKFFSDF